MSYDPGVLRWAEPRRNGDVVAHPFAGHCSSGAVPGIAWYGAMPTASRWPLVLLGYGGSSHKSSTRNVPLATRLVQDLQINAVALDGPFHGDRSLAPGVDYQEAMVDAGVETVIDHVADEWLDLLRVVSEDSPLIYDSLGYLGLSMGSRFGVSLIARPGDQLNAAVLGKFGLRHSGMLHLGLNRPQHTQTRGRECVAGLPRTTSQSESPRLGIARVLQASFRRARSPAARSSAGSGAGWSIVGRMAGGPVQVWSVEWS